MSPPPGAPDVPAFRDLASRITQTRAAFAQVYDDVRSAVPDSRPFLTVAAGATADGVAFERALRQAHEEGWYELLGERLIQGEFLFPDRSPEETTLQATVSQLRGYPDATTVEGGWLDARARLCVVEVAGLDGQAPTTGTGFLVGPSMVLTAFHVVAGLVADGTPVPDAQRRLIVRFDHATGRRDTAQLRVPEDWLVAWSPPHPAEIGTTGGVPAPRAAPGEDLTDHLDYAVIVVAGSPGSERGFYDLARVVDHGAEGTAHLLQHPMGLQQRVTDGDLRGFRPGTKDQRFDHDANAERGSSGGLVVDGNYALVGLHQGAYGHPVVNTGISAVAIRADIEAKQVNLLDAKYAQAYRVADGSRPILGRSRCQEWIRRSQPLIRVRRSGGNKGVSFTRQIMRACLPEQTHLIACVEVVELDSDAMTTAGIILDRLGVDATGLPTEPDANTSRGAWLAQLVGAFGERVGQTHPGRTVWLVFDELENRTIPDGSVRDLLSELYRQAEGFPNLRIVLLGMNALPSGFPTGFIDDEDISPPQPIDIVSYLRIRLTAKGVAHSLAEAERMANLIAKTSTLDIQKLSDYVAEIVDRVLDEEIGGP